MTFHHRAKFLPGSILLVLSALLAVVAHADPSKAVPRLRIKSGRAINVRLGSHREAADGVRSEKGTWKLVVNPDLAGALAEFEDVTPGVAHSTWNVTVEGDHVVLDSKLFLATHVYRMEVRKERRTLGKTVIYLYPPPQRPGAGRVDFGHDHAVPAEAGLSPVPKGQL